MIGVPADRGADEREREGDGEPAASRTVLHGGNVPAPPSGVNTCLIGASPKTLHTTIIPRHWI
jgi:hypothetical protein